MAPKIPHIPSLDFSGQTAVVTGTTNGLGLAVSKQLLQQHKLGTLIMGVRNVTRGEETKTQLLADAKTTNPKAVVHVVRLDMEDYNNCITFSDEVKKLTADSGLDMVLLNAGMGITKYETAVTGHEKTLQVNVLSNAMLILELLPLLVETAQRKKRASRLTWVGSFVQMDHNLGKWPVPADKKVLAYFDDPVQFERKGPNPFAIMPYSNSILLTTMFVAELAKRVDRKDVVLNEVSPGMVITNFGANLFLGVRLLLKIATVIPLGTRSLQDGGRTYIHALATHGEESHGEYISDNKISP